MKMDRTILEFIYVLAMREATIQQAFKGEKRQLTDVKKNKETVDILETFVNDAINVGFQYQEDYDKRFYNTANNICDKINKYNIEGNGVFNFGNAQKLINMTMKYLYIMCYKHEEKRELFRFCHCPMDSILLKHVWEKRKDLPEWNNWKREDFLASWGNEKDGHERYNAFQKAIKELKDDNQYALEYDYQIWGDNK